MNILELKGSTVKLHKADGYYDTAERQNAYHHRERILAWENRNLSQAIEMFSRPEYQNPNVVIELDRDSTNLLEVAIAAKKFTVAEDILCLIRFDKDLDSNLNALVNYPYIDVLNLFIKYRFNVLKVAQAVVENTNDPVVADTICRLGFVPTSDLEITRPGIITILIKYDYVVPENMVFYATGKVLEEILMLNPSLAQLTRDGNDPLQYTCLELAEQVKIRKTHRYKNRARIFNGVYDSLYDEYDRLVDRIAPLLRFGCKIDNIQPTGVHAYELSPEIKEAIEATGLVRPSTLDSSEDAILGQFESMNIGNSQSSSRGSVRLSDTVSEPVFFRRK